MTASPSITNCVFSGNIASTGGGGAIINFSGTPVITNCTISGNTAFLGGGLYNGNSTPIFTNTIIWGNTASDIGKSLFNLDATPVYSYSDIQDGVVVGTGNISTDPLFTNAAGGDYSLQNGSPCLNTGTPDTTGLHTGNTDIAGNPRITGTVIDMGAFESSGTPLPVNLISFTGKLLSSVANLEWQTGVEDNVNYFELQKGTDGKIFSTVATLNAKGENSYYTANVLQAEVKAYYRLKIVDNNGRFKYSGVITLSQNVRNNVSVYPNPAKDYININTEQAGHVGIYSNSGILVRTVLLEAGLNKIDVSELASGFYFIVSGTDRIKFIKR